MCPSVVFIRELAPEVPAEPEVPDVPEVAVTNVSKLGVKTIDTTCQVPDFQKS